MATFNSSSNVLNSSVKSTEAVQSTAAFLLPSPSPLLGLTAPSFATTSSSVENQSYIGIQQKNLPSLTHHHVNSLSSFTFMEIKREPCQVSEVTTSNNLHTNLNSKSLSSSTMTTLVKIESTSPKISDMDKSTTEMHTNNSMQVGLTRKKPPDTAPVQSPRDVNYFGIRVADIGGVSAGGCGNIYFAGTDLMPGGNNEDISSIHNESRSSTFWQYPNAFPLESVISMSPVGLQYARDPGRGQLVLIPTTSAMDSFPQAAFLWPPYMQQNPTALQTTPNFIFPSMSPQTSALPPTYGAPLQLLGPNYLTTASASSTVCHHSQAVGNSFLSISSDTRRTELSQKHNPMKMETFNPHHSLNKGNLTSNFDTTNKVVDKSKDHQESSYSLSNANLVGPVPLIQNNEQSHSLLNNTHSPSELLTIPMIPANYTIPANMAPLTPPQMGDVGATYKNSAVRSSGFLKTPEMQDVNIQTDTPVCSDDESAPTEFNSTELVSYNLQQPLDKFRSVSSLCHNNCVGCKTTSSSKENSIDSLPQCTTTSYDIAKHNTSLPAMPETYVYEKECISNRSANKNEIYNTESSTILPSAESNSESSTFKPTSNSTAPAPLLEMSGLELLSNISTGSFVNHDSLKAVRVKQEPCENIENERTNDSLNNSEPYGLNCSNTFEISNPDPKEKVNLCDSIKTSTPRGEEKSLGGLNLLCALAEQRIQEEVENNNLTTKESSSETKKRKHKHSKSKSNKQSRYYKGKNKHKFLKDRKRSDSDDAHENLRSVFRKVDPNYKKLNKWPDPEDFFKAMESDMRMRLADITRQYKKKKRKLDEINKIKKRKKSSEYKFANISCKNPSFICFLDKFQSTTSNFPPSADETEIKCLSFQNKNLAGGNMTETTIKNNENTSSVVLSEATSAIRLNTQRASESFVMSEKQRLKSKKYKTKNIPTLKVDRSTFESSLLTTTKCQQEQQSKQQQQQTKKEQTQQKQNTVIKEENKFALKIDKEIVLSNEHLYRKETRVLTDMGGLFYAGILRPLQPPDVYAITLDGERGNKSHIMSREEILKDAILEVVPKTIKNVPTGTRLCAYWSQQYRCLYPGKAIDSETTDVGSDFVSVEFDDGDSGRIRLQNIRYLMSDYPIVEYNENPFNNLGKNKKSSCTKNTSLSNGSNEETGFESGIQENNKISFKSRTDKTKNQFHHKISSHISKLNECEHKHTKHRKKKKHKKHHRKSSSSQNSITVINEEHTEIQNFNYKELKSDQLEEQTVNELDTGVENSDLDKPNIKLLLHIDEKPEINGLEDEDSTSNVVSENSDETRNERIDYNSGKGSKIAAFLPERQLWGWLGQAYRKAGLKGRARKQFFKSITRGKETITVGECAVFLSTGRPDRPYIGRIEAMWETISSNKVVRVRWFYHPEETTGCPTLKYPGALFDSPHEDENDVQTISHRCEVIEFSMYIAKFGSDSAQYQSIYDNNDTYYLSGYYNPRSQVLKMQPDIPTLDGTSL
ncbi:protein winged eye [Episyrphus balteatus]|uniref:protein winged eye n=1 Tax=Episyrphus balteatus TaxID=286459 RepID=UPI002485CF6E|nr:protein winged eye [Episyrphus balteatus]XP_055848751.1 protein winged eye [Episyrphus balteatus]